MPEIDRYTSFVLVAFGTTWLVLGGYLLYLRSRIQGLKRALKRMDRP